MKKVLALLMAAAMILSLAACGSKNPDSNDDSNDKKTALILGTSADYAPFEFMYPDDKGELTYAGIDVSVAQYIADDMGLSLQVENMAFEYLLTSLGKGDFDMVLAAMEATPDRLENADFSDPYYNDIPPAILVKADKADQFKTLADFAGKSVGAQAATTKLDIIADSMPGANAVSLQSVLDLINDLTYDKVDAIVVDGGVAQQYAESNPDLVIADDSKSLSDGVIEPWGGGKTTTEYYGHVLQGLADELGFSMDTPWRDLPEDVRHSILYGHDFKVNVSYRNRWGRLREYSTGFEGVVRTLMRRYHETDSDQMKQYYESYMREVPCQACNGRRLRPEVLAVTVDGESIADVCDMPVERGLAWINGLKLEGAAATIAGEVVKEIRARLGFLNDVGLNYLTLSRAAKTLSGGEAQRIRLATQIGSGLVGVMYVLDEPSIGLHQRDNARLIETLHHLRDLGNTLIVVEHDQETIERADWVVDIGPGAGEHGGEVIYSGPAKRLIEAPRSVTGDYIAGRRSIEVPAVRRKPHATKRLRVVGARENNLKNITVDFPLGVMTVVTGVSGSGKSTLVNTILYPVLADKLNGARIVPGKHTRVEGLDQCDKVIHVDQNPIGRTPRSNPATYTGVWDKIRTLLAKTPEAQVRGYGPGRFSFNVKGGRCEACHGDGTLKIEMNFLPDVYVECEECHGKRYNRETLEVKYNGKTVADVLDMPIEEAATFFKAYPSISRYLDTLVQVGLGYIRLGQPAPTLSGGESQRVKLATELQRRSTGKTVYILDEPTTGLHFEDVRKLLLVLQGLVDKGNTVIVIEHNLDVVKSADWIIDLGPEGGDGGGTIVTQGTPEQVAQCEASWTGKFLKDML